jgi:inorganic phosphate transporter, PiT family
VIYTHSLKPAYAVVWSGCWNLIGVLTSSGAVAFGIVALLPVELVINVGSGAGFAMVFALLVSAIVWNLGTWYLGLPASSSHTLIGSIVGVGLMNSLMSPDAQFGDGVNWGKVADTVKALVLSPIIGFALAAALLWLLRTLLKNQKDLFQSPEGDKAPPWWIRLLLIGTCTGVSFAHGSNDGQKGMGLIVLILVGIVPTTFALDMHATGDSLSKLSASAVTFEQHLEQLVPATAAIPDTESAHKQLTGYLRKGAPTDSTLAALEAANKRVVDGMKGVTALATVEPAQRRSLRMDIYLVSETLARMAKAKQLPANLDAKQAGDYQKQLRALTNYIPTWVKFAVAIALGLGTMIGWKRIVVTVGEKIGKAHLTYAQGASAELVAFGCIEAADQLGLPVSTTHVLSSGIAGTMVANGSGLQKETVRNILMAWVLTLPVCVLLGAMLFAAGLYFVLHVAGVP